MSTTTESRSLEERLVRKYLAWKPVPNSSDVFDESGNIKWEVKNSPAYKGLIDALMGRPSFAASSLSHQIWNSSETFSYACGYADGKLFSERLKASRKLYKRQ